MDKRAVETSLNFDNDCEITCPHCECDFSIYLQQYEEFKGKYTTEIVIEVKCPNCGEFFDVYTRIKNV